MPQTSQFRDETARREPRRASPRRPRRKLGFGAFRRNEDGTAAVDFAFVAVPLLIMVMGTMDVGIQLFADRMLTTGVDQAARQIRTGAFRGTGNAQTDAQDFIDLLCDLPSMAMFDCNRLVVSVETVADYRPKTGPQRDSQGNLLRAPSYNAGGRSTINVVKAEYEWPALINFEKLRLTASGAPNGSFDGDQPVILTAYSAFTNEPF